MMTGNLNSDVNSNPPFPGKERHLLRAQLARIQHNTDICPNGLYDKEKDEETGEYKLAEDAPSMKTDDLSDTANWAHLHPFILKSGRCEHYIPAGLDDEKREELENELNEKDKPEERFRAINEDAGMEGEQEAWTHKLKGDKQVYGDNCYGVNVITSNRWPGATTVAKGGKFYSIYIGDAIKAAGNLYNPTEPPALNKDPAETDD